ncbi:MAG TPA: hypothetical protein VMB81_00345 [Candidatus Sulfotelmatobacter sp.]|nr:hypothetical protein [Candidatus Sulfotelmatobacter sp.]
MKPDALLAFAHTLAAGPTADEPHWREAVIVAHRAVHHLVAAHLGLDPATFAGTPRAVREALAMIDPTLAPTFIRVARRHFTTNWIAAERAAQSATPVGPRDAALALAYADAVLAARAAAN